MSEAFLVEILSAGVITSLVAGIFSLVIAIKNNTRLLDIENNKQHFMISQERFRGLKEAYEQLLELLPKEQHVSFVMVNDYLKCGVDENYIVSVHQLVEQNMKILFKHSQRYGYLLNMNTRKNIADFIDEIDNYATNKQFAERVMKYVEFEEFYFDLFANILSEMANID